MAGSLGNHSHSVKPDKRNSIILLYIVNLICFVILSLCACIFCGIWGSEVQIYFNSGISKSRQKQDLCSSPSVLDYSHLVLLTDRQSRLAIYRLTVDVFYTLRLVTCTIHVFFSLNLKVTESCVLDFSLMKI